MRYLILILVLFLATPVNASGKFPLKKHQLGRDAALIQAQSCVGEVGFEDIDACVAMTFVHAKRAKRKGMKLKTMVGLYSWAYRFPQRPWVRHLRADGKKPKHWSNASWQKHRAGWLATLAAVRLTVKGGVVDPCPRSIHYGGPMDKPSPKLSRLDCVDSKQIFYSRKSE